MNSSGQQRGTKVTIVLGFLALASIAAIVVALRSSNAAALNQSKLQLAESQRQIEARDLEIVELKTEVRNLRAVLGASSKPRTGTRTSASAADQQLGRQLADLVAAQSNTLAVIENLKAGVRDSEAAAEGRTANQAALAALETSANDAEQNAEAARQKSEELLSTLNVPAGISGADAAWALANSNLQAYWPYFEAKREEENLQRIAEALRLRLLQATIDSSADAAPANPP